MTTCTRSTKTIHNYLGQYKTTSNVIYCYTPQHHGFFLGPSLVTFQGLQKGQPQRRSKPAVYWWKQHGDKQERHSRAEQNAYHRQVKGDSIRIGNNG